MDDTGKAGLFDLIEQADTKIRRVAATIALLISAASEQRLGQEWEGSLSLLQDELDKALDLQRQIKGAALPPPEVML
ncbi:hypothetical protein ACJJJB_00230 (plasmid) [Microbulbifer sp. ANSA001]|uniref:hypothetical protein n=1 Tax=Microbulbifer sp. ANSA001 TaxID=3243358 RepID=UPI00404330B9